MKATMLVVALLVMVGCQNIDALGPGNTLAMENQSNLDKNVMRQLNNFEKLAKAQPNWTENDAKVFAEQKAVVIEQLVLNYAWLLVIKEAVEANNLDPSFFGLVLDKAPEWIQNGKDIYDLIKDLSKK